MRVQEIVTHHYQKRYVVVDESGNLVVPVIRYLKYLDAIGRARNTLRSYAHGLSLYFASRLSGMRSQEQKALVECAKQVMQEEGAH